MTCEKIGNKIKLNDIKLDTHTEELTLSSYKVSKVEAGALKKTRRLSYLT